MNEGRDELRLSQTIVSFKESQLQVAVTHYLILLTFQMMAPTAEVENIASKNEFFRKYNVFTFGKVKNEGLWNIKKICLSNQQVHEKTCFSGDRMFG